MLYDFLLLRREEKLPLCTQLYAGLKQAILDGNLAAGEKLASIRQTAEELEVSRTTVETAYARLCMEGYVDSRPQSGYRVRNVLPHRDAPPPPRRSRILYDFGTASIDPQAADLENWKKLVRAVLTDAKTVTSYGDPQGERYLREQLAGYAFRARGAAADPDCIFIGAGVGPLLQLLCPLFPSRPPVCFESPGFGLAEQIFRDYGFPVYTPAADSTEERPCGFPQQAQAIQAELPSLRPRAGSAAAAARRRQLVQWVNAQPGRFVLEDDYNGELHYRSRGTPAFQSSCPEKTIYLGSFSKLLLPSVRAAYMVLPPALAAEAAERVRTLNQTAGKTEQLALAEYIRTGLLEKHLRRLRRLYAQKSQLLLDALEKTFGSRAQYTLYETHLSVVVSFCAGADSRRLCQLAARAGAACTVQGGFDTRPQIALGFSGIESGRIAEGVRVLGRVWEGLV